jgi:hypothetical protein
VAKAKFDGVIESVRYGADGKITWVRAYERRGATFSDWVLLDRAALVERLKAGKKFVIGRRVPLLSSTFETSLPIRLVEKEDGAIVVAGDTGSETDRGREFLPEATII